MAGTMFTLHCSRRAADALSCVCARVCACVTDRGVWILMIWDTLPYFPPKNSGWGGSFTRAGTRTGLVPSVRSETTTMELNAPARERDAVAWVTTPRGPSV